MSFKKQQLAIPKLAIITTHPIQYNAPLFRLLSKRGKISVKVYYTWGQSKDKVYDARFGIERNWDVPLLEGYDYEFINSITKHPDSNRFFGIINRGLYKKIKKEQFDAVLIFRWSLLSHLLLMQQLGENPLLFFRGDSHLLQKVKGLKSIFKNWALRFIYRRVDIAFATGTYNRDYFLFSGLQPHQIITAPHAVDNTFFEIDEEINENKALTQRRKIGIPDNAIVFLYAGKFYKLKQLDLLIKGFRKLQSENHYLLLVGNGEQEEELRTLSQLNKRIIFYPFQNQSAMPSVYRMGDVFVLPSKSETWGLSVNEAMACKRPVLVSDQCGCAPDLVIDGETGYVFQSGNEEHLIKQLMKFTDKEITQKMGRIAGTYIQQFSLEKIADLIEQILIQKRL
jgi:glycosyltransferase involved in cell wall biosynthesis